MINLLEQKKSKMYSKGEEKWLHSKLQMAPALTSFFPYI